jgi:hypothetical protein
MVYIPRKTVVFGIIFYNNGIGGDLFHEKPGEINATSSGERN